MIIAFRRQDEVELHGFSGASGAAYGAVSVCFKR